MKNQKISAILKDQFRAVPQRSIIFLFAIIIGLIFGAADNVFAQFPREISVKVGEIKTFKGDREILEEGAKAEIRNQTIARTRFDAVKKEFRVQGLKEGTTQVVFSGTYIEGRTITERMQPTFSVSLKVTVLPQTETTANNPTNTTNPNPTNTATPNQTNTTDSNFYRVQINRNEIKNFTIATILRQESDKNIEGLDLQSGDNNIARGDYDVGRTIRITGIGSGNTRLTLIGKIINNNEEQPVRRIIEVTVAEGSNPTNTPPDSWLASRQQDFQALKKAAAQAGTNERSLDYSIQQFGSFVRRIEAEILRESNSLTPRQLREALLKNLRDEASSDLSRLRGELAKIAEQVRPISWYNAIQDLNIILGELPARRTFFCPANPEGRLSSVEVYGTDRYLSSSTLCVAALHDGAVTLAGGNITVEFHKGMKGDKYIGSRRNGVTTESWERPWGYFIFVK